MYVAVLGVTRVAMWGTSEVWGDQTRVKVDGPPTHNTRVLLGWHQAAMSWLSTKAMCRALMELVLAGFRHVLMYDYYYTVV